MFVKYKYQPLVCFHCNKWGHKNSECPRRKACPRCGEDHRARDCSLSWEMPSVQPCLDESTTPDASSTSNPQHNGDLEIGNEVLDNSQGDDNNNDVASQQFENLQALFSSIDNSQSSSSSTQGISSSLTKDSPSSLTPGKSFSDVLQDCSPPDTFPPPTPLTPQALLSAKPMELQHTSLKRPADTLPANKANKSKSKPGAKQKSK